MRTSFGRGVGWLEAAVPLAAAPASRDGGGRLDRGREVVVGPSSKPRRKRAEEGTGRRGAGAARRTLDPRGVPDAIVGEAG